MPREKKDKHFIHKPTYPGGRTALRKFISENLKYPEEALKNAIEGTVSVKYTVDYKGKVIEAHVVSSLGHGCDEEALRVVKLLKFDVPKNYKVKVKFHKDIHVHFRLPERRQTAPSPVTYQYTTTPPSGKRPASPKPGVYHYRINIGGNPDEKA